jgi:hypothetical protein
MATTACFVPWNFSGDDLRTVEDVISWGDLSVGQLAAVADSVNHQAGGAREDTNESWADNLSDRFIPYNRPIWRLAAFA